MTWRRWGGWLILAASLGSAYWVFFRPQSAAVGREITIRLAHWQLEMGPPDGMAAVIKRYEELNPRVHVEQILVPSSVYIQWMRTNFAGDTAPDIVEYAAWLGGLADLPVRHFEPLTNALLEPNPYNVDTPLQGVPWLKTFADELLEERMYSPEPGQYYTVTLSRGAYRLFTNRHLLQAITGSTEPPADFQALRRIFAQTADYARRRGRPLFPFAGSQDNALWLMNFYMGGVLGKLSLSLDHDGLLALYSRQVEWSFLRGEWSYRQPAPRAGLALLAELHAQMKPGYLQTQRDEAVRQFLQGDALFLFVGTWEATTLRRLADFPVDALRCPQPGPDDPVVGPYLLGRFADGSDVTGFGLSLNKRSLHQREAVDFLRFLTSYEGNKLFAEHSGWPPSVRTVPMPPAIQEFVSPADGYAVTGLNVPIAGSTGSVFKQNLHLLSQPDGVERLAQALDRDLPSVSRATLQNEERLALWAVLPQDTRLIALSGVLAASPDAAVMLRRQRLEAAQNLSEARALLLHRQLEMLPPP